MDKQNWYFEQLVTQAQMDTAFDNIEAADHNQHTDGGFVGINSGFGITSNGDLTVAVAAGIAYDAAGQRIAGVGDPTLDCSVDYLGNPTTVAVASNEKWLSVFAVFNRVLQTPAVDGNGVSLSYDLVEGMTLEVYQEAEAAAGTFATYNAVAAEPYALADGQTLDISVNGTTPQTVTFNTADFADIANATSLEVGAVITAQTSGIVTSVSVTPSLNMRTVATGTLASLFVTGGSGAAVFAWPSTAGVGAGGPARPALRADAVLLGDILLREGSSIIQDAPDGTDSVIDLAGRREWMFIYEGDFDIKVGTTEEFMQAAAGIVNSHITNAGNAHPASAITYDPTELPIDGNGPSRWTELKTAGTVQEAIDSFQAILAPTSGTDSGSNNLTFETLADGTLTSGRGTPIWALGTTTGHGKDWTDLQADMIEAFANRLEDESVTGAWDFVGDVTADVVDINTLDVLTNLSVSGSILGPISGGTQLRWTGETSVDRLYVRETATTANDDYSIARYQSQNCPSGSTTTISFGSVGGIIPTNSICMAEIFIVGAEDAGGNTGYHRKMCIRFDTDGTQINNTAALGDDDSNDFTAGNLVTNVITPTNFGTAIKIDCVVIGGTAYNVGVYVRLITVAE